MNSFGERMKEAIEKVTKKQIQESYDKVIRTAQRIKNYPYDLNRKQYRIVEYLQVIHEDNDSSHVDLSYTIDDFEYSYYDIGEFILDILKKQRIDNSHERLTLNFLRELYYEQIESQMMMDEYYLEKELYNNLHTLDQLYGHPIPTLNIKSENNE